MELVTKHMKHMEGKDRWGTQVSILPLVQFVLWPGPAMRRNLRVKKEGMKKNSDDVRQIWAWAQQEGGSWLEDSIAWLESPVYHTHLCYWQVSANTQQMSPINCLEDWQTKFDFFNVL